MWFAKRAINQLKMYKDLQAEYNLEFQGSVRNLQERALFMKFYPEMPRNNTEMR